MHNITPEQRQAQREAYQTFEEALTPIKGISSELNELIKRRRVRDAVMELGAVHRLSRLERDPTWDGFEHYDIAGGGEYNLAPADQ